jgi:hypothetical protein
MTRRHGLEMRLCCAEWTSEVRVPVCRGCHAGGCWFESRRSRLFRGATRDTRNVPVRQCNYTIAIGDRHTIDPDRAARRNRLLRRTAPPG